MHNEIIRVLSISLAIFEGYSHAWPPDLPPRAADVLSDVRDPRPEAAGKRYWIRLRPEIPRRSSYDGKGPDAAGLAVAGRTAKPRGGPGLDQLGAHRPSPAQGQDRPPRLLDLL